MVIYIGLTKIPVYQDRNQPLSALLSGEVDEDDAPACAPVFFQPVGQCRVDLVGEGLRRAVGQSCGAGKGDAPTPGVFRLGCHGFQIADGGCYLLGGFLVRLVLVFVLQQGVAFLSVLVAQGQQAGGVIGQPEQAAPG